MKLLICILPFLIISCAHQKEYYIKYSDKTAEVQSELDEQGEQYKIHFKVKCNSEIISAPTIIVMENKTAVLRISKEIFLPVEWSHPEIQEKEDGAKVFKPAAPVFADPSDFGISIEVTAAGVETLNADNWIHLQGTMKYSEIDQKPDIQDNIDALQNYTVGFTTDTVLYSVFVKNGSSSTFKMKLNVNSYEITIYASKLKKR